MTGVWWAGLPLALIVFMVAVIRFDQWLGLHLCQDCGQFHRQASGQCRACAALWFVAVAQGRRRTWVRARRAAIKAHLRGDHFRRFVDDYLAQGQWTRPLRRVA